MSARVAPLLLVALLLAVAGCGSGDEPAPAAPAETSASEESDPGRVGVAAEPPKSPAALCSGLSRKKSSKLGKSAFSLCTSSAAKARRTKSVAKACRGLSAKRDKTLRTSPKSICRKAAKDALASAKARGRKAGDESAAGADGEDSGTDGEDSGTDGEDLDAAEPDAEDELLEGEPGTDEEPLEP